MGYALRLTHPTNILFITKCILKIMKFELNAGHYFNNCLVLLVFSVSSSNFNKLA